jgi:hypothetical protein
MRRFTWLLLLLGLALPHPAAAQADAGYPHGFLFGAWVGGTFPAPTTLNARECRANPTDASYAQSLVETVPDSGNGVEFRLLRVGSAPPPSPFGLGGGLGADAGGFGCGSPTVLRVTRRGENEITFPNCSAFPYPLVRCPAH